MQILRAAILASSLPWLCASTFEQKVDAIFAPVAGGDKPGAAVVVLSHGKPVLAKGYGMADVEKHVPITPSTIFRLASVTKSFTATAILQLVEKGKVRLDDPLSKYVPDFPNADRIHISHLLSHTAGLADFVSYEELTKRPLEFEPGSRINYSNNGYQLLGRVLEVASRQPWHEYMRDHIFLPLGMKHTGYDKDPVLPGRAIGYLLGKDGAYRATATDDARGAGVAGGLYSTVEDMARWAQALADGKVLRKETLNRATTPGLLTDGRRTRYGLGWMTSKYRGLREFGHGGDITGFNTSFLVYPDEKLTVIVLSNTGMRPPGPLPEASVIAHRVAEAFAGDRMEKPDAPINVRVDPKLLDKYAGRYKVEAPPIVLQNMGEHMVIVRSGDALVAEVGPMKIPLSAHSETTFQAPGSPVEVTFVCGDAPQCPKMMLTLMGLREFQALRVP